jgi:integrase
MATITKRGPRWFAQVRRKGFAAKYKSFATKGEAQTWTRQQEALIDGGQGIAVAGLQRRMTLRELLSRYMTEVSPKKRGAASEISRLTKMQRSPMCDLALQSLTPTAIAHYRDQRLGEAQPGTVRREIATLRHALALGTREWGVVLSFNPASAIALPIANDARNRRLNPGDLDRLLKASLTSRNKAVKSIVLLAIETGLRRGEILGLQWRHICLETRVAHIPLTKTGTARTIPLTEAACDILGDQNEGDGQVFCLSANALRQAWERLRNRAGLPDLRFHDLRHEAISRFCELGLTIPEVASISGHKDARMLMRYTHLRADDLAKRLAEKRWGDARSTIINPTDNNDINRAIVD